jgi:hypothetical protein
MNHLKQPTIWTNVWKIYPIQMQLYAKPILALHVAKVPMGLCLMPPSSL